MYLIQILPCFALGFVPCWILISLILKRADKDQTAGRKDFHHTHKTPVSRLGGIAMMCSFIAVVLAIYLCTPLPDTSAWTLGVIACSSLAMFGLGFWDDVRKLGAKFKLTGQVLIASGVYLCNIRIELLKNPFTGDDLQLGIMGYFATVLWLIGLTNLINLIDGIDGLAAGISLMLMLLMANLGVTDNLGFCMLLSIGMAGALAGFLKFNYPPAKIYMGDSGAYFLGFLIGILSIVNANKGTIMAALIAPAFALALPIVDVGLAILRRGLRGLPVFRPDQKHIHHHLITLGISRERTLLNLYTVSLLCLFLALCLFCVQGRFLPLYTGLLLVVLLIAGHLSGFTKDWSKISSQIGKSLSLRKETRYALSLDKWFILAVERHKSMETLREDYWFLVKKLGFSRVELTLPDGAIFAWQASGVELSAKNSLRAVHAISDGTSIDFTASRDTMSEDVFVLFGDLASEIWYKAAARCQSVAMEPNAASKLRANAAELAKQCLKNGIIQRNVVMDTVYCLMDNEMPSIKYVDLNEEPISSSRRTILIVEDEIEVSQTIVHMLEELGYASVPCSHGIAALDLVQSRKFDLLLIDYRMPEMTGLDLISMLREESCKIPVIMMTGHLATEERISSEYAGEFIVLRKPLTLPQLESAIKDSLKEAAAS